MSELDPLTLDRDVARAARAERAWWRTLRVDASRAAAEVWYEPFRHVTTRTTFQEVAALPAGDPLRDPLLAWIHRLSLTRIAQMPTVALARARQEATLRLEEPEPGLHSVRAIVHRVLAERDRGRARAWLQALARDPPPLLAHQKTLREATQEITARLGVADPSSLVPFDRASVQGEAEQFLRVTNDLAGSIAKDTGDLAALVAKLLARDVPGVWPTRPDARWLFEQFQTSPLLQGLTLDLGPTPAALGGASFARSLARFGTAYARSAVLGGAPFVAMSDASEVHPLRRGALFASLAADPVFLRRKVGLSRDASRAASRALVATFLVALRLGAAAATVDVVRDSPAAIGEIVEDTLKVPAPLELCGVFPRLHRKAAERFLASLLGFVDGVELASRFDEDWFRNPRGLLHLRELDAAPRPAKVSPATVRGAAAKLAQALETRA
jgi:hypothetical protein